MTYNKDTAQVEPRSQEEWLNLILDDGSDYWGDDITEREDTALHYFYEPYAGRLAELEQQLQQVHEALRVDDAEGQELDYLGERLGVSRREAEKSTGEVKFSRSTEATKDYYIQKGTVLETGSIDSIEFVTTEQGLIESGTKEDTVKVEARRSGSQANVASNTITETFSDIVGVESVTNPVQTSGGRDIEKDKSYRNRIKTSVGEIDVTSGQVIFNELSSLEYVKEIRFIDNSEDEAGSDLNAHETEIVVDSESGHSDEIAQIIFNNTPAGVNLVSGVHGQSNSGVATLDNSQSFTIPYSTPYTKQIYVDADVTLSSDVDKDIIKNNIVEYIGGTKTNGSNIYGQLNVSEDVLYGEVEYNIRNTDETYDITSLKIGTSDNPTGTSNIEIQTNERAVIDYSNIDITTTIR